MTKHFLTAIALLLSLFTYTEAQHNIDGFKDWNERRALEGLGEIGLIVKYGNVGGLATSIQPSILRMLGDRARDMLLQGGVPLTESTDEADMVDKPRLVFIVTIKKDDTAPSVHIEGKLFQRGRLWRDPSLELELVTWSGSSTNPRVDHVGLSTFFDKQVSVFVRDYKAANPNASRVENRATEPPAPLKVNASALQGLNGVDSITSLQFYELVDDRLQLISNTLRDESAKKLRQAGIPLVRRADMARAGYPLLNIVVSLNPKGVSYAHAIEVRTEFWQRAFFGQDSNKFTYIKTWELRSNDDSSISEEAVLKVVNSHLDQFIDAYKSANPKPSSVQTVPAPSGNTL